jgi:hypothetical protein
MKYYVDSANRYLGGWDNSPPSGAVEVPLPPEDARQVWGGSAWLPCAEVERERFKASRASAVERITVTTNSGMTFDGDEVSQGRMARAIIGLQNSEPGTLIRWVLADNTTVDVSVDQLTEALTLAGLRQAELWVKA